ncbi:MAG: BACON domain-containing protein [Prevotella sp.]|nr:BACON domain-containing protein [Prevotella sp.]
MKGKNILSALLLLLCPLLVSTSCSDDEQDESQAPAITIVSSDLLFDPQGRTGSVQVQTATPVTAEVSASWATATVEGSVVSVTVSDNTDFEGRTALLTLRAGDAQRVLPIQQRGIALGTLSQTSYHASNRGETKAFYIRHDLPLQVSTDEDWLQARVEGDSIIIQVAPNDDWFVRRGVLSYDCGGYTGELVVTQYEMSNILGEYYFGGNMSGAGTGFRFRLMQEDNKFYMKFFTVETWANDLSPVDFDEGRCALIIHSSTPIHQESNGRYDAFYLYSRDADGATMAGSTSATVAAELYYNPVWGTSFGSFEGTWGNKPLTGFIIRSTSPFVGTTTYIQLEDPYIVWLGNGQNTTLPL